MEKFYKIGENDLKTLLKSYHELSMLEQGGVDNWSWYGENRIGYIASVLGLTYQEVEDNDYDLDDIVKQELESYEEV